MLAMISCRDNDTLVLQVREIPRMGETPVMNSLPTIRLIGSHLSGLTGLNRKYDK